MTPMASELNAQTHGAFSPVARFVGHAFPIVVTIGHKSNERRAGVPARSLALGRVTSACARSSHAACGR